GAEPLCREALAMYRTLYPRAQFPAGHPDLANSLSNLATLLGARRDYAGAEPFLRDALAMDRALYPRAQYPAGHPLLARSLTNRGWLLRARGDYAGAAPLCRDALAMSQGLAGLFADVSAEAESLNYLLAQLPGSRDLFLSVTANAPESSPSEAYAV